MMTNNRKFHVTAFLFALFLSLFAASIPNVQADQDTSFDENQIQQLLKENKIPALGIGIIKDGKLKHVKVFGELKKGEPAPLNTIFNVASLTKPIVALLTLRLVSSGKWSLDEPLDKYWIDPDLQNDPRHKKLTTRLVLSHQTGFPNWRWLTKSKKLEFVIEPGTKYQYSGEGFEYLRKALEKKFKRPIEELANDLIFKPLKMRDTRFVWDAEQIGSRFAMGHNAEGNAYEINKTTKANAADDLLTTVEDYGTFLVSVMKGDGLSKDVCNEMVGHQVATKENKYFGLGWEIYDLGNGNYALSHGGSDEGTKTQVFLLPKSGDGLIIFTNSDNGTNIYLKLITGYLKDYGKQIIDIEMKGSSVAHAHAGALDVLHYAATLEPDIAGKSVKGTVRIRFATASHEAEFNCGDLAIDSVRLAGAALKFSVVDHRLKVSLPPNPQPRQAREIEIDFHGTPRWGIRFFPGRQQVYTIFSTSQWMVCVDDPADKATLTFKLILPANLTPVANGQLVSQRELPNKRRVSEWRQETPIPTYIFGFAAGPFHVVKEKRRNVELLYFATNYTESEVRRIFRDTPGMLDFFEDRAGVKYADRTYSQVLAAGGVEQEMSSFTALKESYGKQLLDNEQDLWLAAHEFAHQWWGNLVTCRDWNHFWLNEGIANFMAAAYLEHRFGRAAYAREIETYRANYEKVRAAGKDKSLVFPDWLNPTRDDRTLVYDKGAYVVHLLREEMGERAFWNGLRLFTRRHFGKSVVTTDFVTAMEEANGKSLKQFFAKWVYLQPQTTSGLSQYNRVSP